jgi:hypothetical protein
MPKTKQQNMLKHIGKTMAHFGISAFSIGGKTFKVAEIPTLRSCTVDGMTGKVRIHVGDKVRVVNEEDGKLGIPAEYVIRQITRGASMDPKGSYHIVCENGHFFLTSNRSGPVVWFNRFEILERAKK